MRGWGMKKSFMERLAAFIVDKRRLFVVLFAVACVLSIFSASKTDVNNELTDYLPDSTQTRQGLEIMNREFITYGDAKVMVSNVTLAQAEELARTAGEAGSEVEALRAKEALAASDAADCRADVSAINAGLAELAERRAARSSPPPA